MINTFKLSFVAESFRYVINGTVCVSIFPDGCICFLLRRKILTGHSTFSLMPYQHSKAARCKHQENSCNILFHMYHTSDPCSPVYPGYLFYPFPKQQMLDSSSVKEFADDNF